MNWLNMTNTSFKYGQINRDKGFTILEVLFAISILSIGILAVASLQASAIRGNDFAGSATNGTIWAADKMEKLIAMAFDDYDDSNLRDTDGDGDGGLDDATIATADHNETQGDWTVLWNISDNSLINNTKTVNVIVNWTNHGAQKSVSMRYAVPRIS
ncbi:MAG: prepilin-type N-terminal cleavage/methylation domain-containing protein [Deltaproteobacteria bacterium]|nr:prepilin-type N-terminal cleavage/methylation domain-containing protein [Deltaproteobacteria bacterium]